MLRAALPIALALAASGCSYLSGYGTSGNAVPAQIAGAAEDVRFESEQPETGAAPADREPGYRHDGIEILWEISPEPVDLYIIRYGFERDQLTEEIRVPASEVERIDDDRHGFVNRHFIPGIPADQRVYLTLSAVSGDEESEPSALLEVEPQ